MKTFLSRTICSPACERIPWNTRRAAAGQSSQVKGVTMPSM